MPSTEYSHEYANAERMKWRERNWIIETHITAAKWGYNGMEPLSQYWRQKRWKNGTLSCRSTILGRKRSSRYWLSSWRSDCTASSAISCLWTPAVSSHSVSAHSGPHSDVTAHRLKTRWYGKMVHVVHVVQTVYVFSVPRTKFQSHAAQVKADKNWREVGRPQVAVYHNCYLFFWNLVYFLGSGFI